MSLNQNQIIGDEVEKEDSSVKQQLKNSQRVLICDVWQNNFEEEFRKIVDVIEEYKYVSLVIFSIDTEFPGVIFYPVLSYNFLNIISFIKQSGNEYAKISKNVERLKLIQIGLTFSKDNGEFPKNTCTWQFNFKFDQQQIKLFYDQKAQGSVKFLEDAGINFNQLHKEGIDHRLFAEYFIQSGLALNDEITWITFHGGFDFAYLIKLLINKEMPTSTKQFYQEINQYFPNILDLKYIVQDIDKLKYGGLQKLSNELNVKRIGQQHQAGSDSLLTLKAYFKLKLLYPQIVVDNKNQNVIHGLEDEYDNKANFMDYYNEHILNEPIQSYQQQSYPTSFMEDYQQLHNQIEYNYIFPSFINPQYQYGYELYNNYDQ